MPLSHGRHIRVSCSLLVWHKIVPGISNYEIIIGGGEAFFVQVLLLRCAYIFWTRDSSTLSIIKSARWKILFKMRKVLQIMWQMHRMFIRINTSKDCVINIFLDCEGYDPKYHVKKYISKSSKSFVDCMGKCITGLFGKYFKRLCERTSLDFQSLLYKKASSVIRCLDRRKHWVQLKTIWSPKYLKIKHQWC